MPTKTKRSPKLPQFLIKERVDVNRVRELLYSDFDIPPESYPTLIQHLNGSGYPVTYTAKANLKTGRCYGNEFALKYLRSDIRAHILQDSFVDLDIVNCFPEILNVLCITYKIKSPYLKDYCENRDEWLKKDPTFKSQIRKVIMGQKISKLPQEIHNELQASSLAVVQRSDTVFDSDSEDDEPNPNSHQWAKDIFKILSSFECEHIMKAKKVLEKLDCKINAYAYDGLIVQKGGEKHLGAVNEAIYPLRMAVKPWKTIKFKPVHSLEYFDWKDDTYTCELVTVNGSTFESIGHMDKEVLPILLRTVRLINSEKVLKKSETSYTQSKSDKDFTSKWQVNPSVNCKKPFTFNLLCSRYLQLITVTGINHFRSTKRGELSLWRGYGFKLVDEVDHDLIHPILNHIKAILCNNNAELYQHHLSWIRHLITKPGTPSEVLYIFAGWGGTGKSTYGEFMEKVLGDWNICKLSGTSKLTRNFNNHLEGKLLVWLEELKSAKENDWIADINTIKDLVDAKTIEIEKKGIDLYHTQNCINLIGFSNNIYCMPPVDGMSRRLVVNETSADVKEDFQYFKDLKESTENPDVVDHFASYIINETKQHNIRDLPQTELGEDAKYRWMDTIKKMLLLTYVKHGEGYYDSNKLKEIGDHYGAFNGKEKNITRLGDEIKRFLGIMERTRRKYHLRITKIFNPTEVEIEKTKELIETIDTENGDNKCQLDDGELLNDEL